MGRSKKKQVAKRRNNLKKRNSIREKMGKPVYFTLTHCGKKLHGISNRYCYKANMHKLCFVDTRFYNVKYQASILTGCNFRGANLVGIDFFNCNMRNASFKNSILENVVFYNCKLKDVNFSGTKFSNVVFICTNINEAKGLDVSNSEIMILRSYPTIDLGVETKSLLLDLANNKTVFNSKVLHVNRKKLNNWSLEVLELRCGEGCIEFLSELLYKKEKWNKLFTIYSYISLIENAGKDDKLDKSCSGTRCGEC